MRGRESRRRFLAYSAALRCGSLCALIALAIPISAASATNTANTDSGSYAKTFKALVPNPGPTGLAWSVPETQKARYESVPRDQAEGRLTELLQVPECYAYVAAAGDPRPNRDHTAKFSGLPVLLSGDEATEKPSWSDWNRLSGSVHFFPWAGGGGIRSFLTVHLFSNRTAYLSFIPNSKNEYNLAEPPVRRVLTRPQLVRYWSKIPRPSYAMGLERDRISWLILGVSPKNFTLGSTSSQPVAADEAAYFVGSGYLLNPYAALSIGFGTQDGRRFTPGIGITLDVDLVTAIFH